MQKNNTHNTPKPSKITAKQQTKTASNTPPNYHANTKTTRNGQRKHSTTNNTLHAHNQQITQKQNTHPAPHKNPQQNNNETDKNNKHPRES
jgi:hypothetical protein